MNLTAEDMMALEILLTVASEVVRKPSRSQVRQASLIVADMLLRARVEVAEEVMA